MPGTGLLATCIPGTFDAWMLMLRDHGTMRLEEVFEAAIGYADNGVPLVPRIIETIETVEELFRAEWPTSAAQWLPGGSATGGGNAAGQQDLAATWRRLIDEAKAVSARPHRTGGGRAARLGRGLRRRGDRPLLPRKRGAGRQRRAPQGRADRRGHGGLARDLRGPADPGLSRPYGLQMRPWSQGPALLQSLALLAEMDVAAMDPLGPDFVHTVPNA